MTSPTHSIPTIETERLIIRPWREDDASDMFEYASDLEVTRLAMWQPNETLDEVKHTIADGIHRYEAETWMYLGIEFKADAKLVGSIGFAQWNKADRRAELSFALNRKYWGRGIVLEAATAVLAFGWNEMHLHRVEARTIEENTPSIAILTKLGFQREGLSREAAFVDGAYRDVINWGLLRTRKSYSSGATDSYSLPRTSYLFPDRFPIHASTSTRRLYPSSDRAE